MYARASFPCGNGISAATDRINRLLVGDLPPERFVTFVVAVLDIALAGQHDSAAHCDLSGNVGLID